MTIRINCCIATFAKLLLFALLHRKQRQEWTCLVCIMMRILWNKVNVTHTQRERLKSQRSNYRASFILLLEEMKRCEGTSPERETERGWWVNLFPRRIWIYVCFTVLKKSCSSWSGQLLTNFVQIFQTEYEKEKEESRCGGGMDM